MKLTTTRRKAVSPVIATLLLILIAVAASIIVYVWVTGYVGGATPQSTPEIMEKIKIDSVKVSGTTVTIYVRNIGDVDVNIGAAYILDPASGTVKAENTSIPTTLTISKGDVGEIIITNANLNSGDVYVAKVVTENGVEAATVFRAP